MKANAHRGDVEIVCNYEIHGWGGGKKQVGEGNKEKKEQRKPERSEESALTEMFIIHSPIHLTLTLTQSSVEELSVTRESAMNFSKCSLCSCPCGQILENKISKFSSVS